MDPSAQERVAALWHAHPLLAHPRLDVTGYRDIVEFSLSALDFNGWTLRDLAEAIEDWPDATVQDWAGPDPGLLWLLFEVANAGLTTSAVRAWMHALCRRVDGELVLTRLCQDLCAEETGWSRTAAIQAYRDATGGAGRLALLAAQAGLTQREARERWEAGTLDVAGLEVLAGLRGSFSPVSA